MGDAARCHSHAITSLECVNPQKMATTRFTILLILSAGLAQFCEAKETQTSCARCHEEEAERVGRSAHAHVACWECHGGDEAAALSPDQERHYAAGGSRPPFEHGPTFRGKPTRKEVPKLCGTCHADVERMNPYGLRTDQLARYWTSGHGKALKSKGDVRVAVCIDCHGAHGVLPAKNPDSRTHPFNVPGVCATCHGDPSLMEAYGLPVEIVDEYQRSVHGRLLFEQQDVGAPTCATCHGNHSAMPPGFATVGAVCGQCHERTEEYFAETAHADQPEHKGCVSCHGGGADRHHHLIERVTRSTSLMTQRYASLLEEEPHPTPERITEAIHPAPRRIMTHALNACTDCHDDIDEDESLPKLFELLDRVAEAERTHVRTARRLDVVGQGVLLVEHQRFKFEDAKTHLIELASLQHSLDPVRVAEKADELIRVCNEVNAELDGLEKGLEWRYRALAPIWIFAVLFAAVLYAKYEQLKKAYVRPCED